MPAEGAQIVIDGYPAGRVTSARRSERVGEVIGLAWVPPERSRADMRFEVRVERRRRGARVMHGAFFDPGGERMRVVSALRFSRRPRCEPELLASPLARALDGADPAAVRDLSLDGKSSSFAATSMPSTPGDGEELVRLSPRRGLLLHRRRPARSRSSALRAAGVRGYDATGALAGFAIASEAAHAAAHRPRPRALPTAGPFAHVAAIVLRDADDRFRVYVPQELGHDVAEAVLDTYEGLEPGWVKRDLPAETHVAAAARAQAPLRRRHRRRRLARACDRVLPREAARDPQRLPSSRSRTSARARRAGTRRSSARTTGRPRAPSSTARA